jgi:IS30 family transposase
MLKHHTKLCLRERELLSSWKQQGLSNKECARRLGRHASTIGRELKRNRYLGNWKFLYEPLHAQAKAEVRKEKAWEANTL